MQNIHIQNITPPELTDALGITVQAVYKTMKANQINLTITKHHRKLVSPEAVRKLFQARGFSYPKQNVSFQIVKGGTGKTSIAYSFAIRASMYGAKVLCIDLDQQANMTRSFRIEARDRPVWLNIFRDKIEARDAIVEISDHLHIIPSNLNNSRLDVELSGSASNLRDMIRDRIASIRDNYDIVIIDCPPAINKINTAATCASDMIIIPLNPEPYAMDGLEFTISELARIKTDFKLKFDFKIVWNRYDARERLGMYYIHDLAKTEHADKVFPFVIRTDSSVKNAIFDASSIFSGKKKSSTREDFDQFTRELLGLNAFAELTKLKNA